MFKIKNLNKTFNNKKILNNLNFEVKAGEIAVFLGESGVGKSTLLRVLANLEKPDSGAFELNNETLKLETINKNHLIGMIFQNFNLFEHMTALKNISFVIEKVEKKSHQEANQLAFKLLKKYGLAEKADTYPSGLSGGQKQRLAIARSLALNPQIMCFDEPTSALDPTLTNFIAQNIKQLAQNDLIILVATHDITLLEKLPATIHLMKDGKIIETATTGAFYQQQDLFPQIKNFIDGIN